MPTRTLIRNATLVSDGKRFEADLAIEGERIAKIDSDITAEATDTVVDAAGKLLLPGMIDSQVHFREPGLTAKGELATESAAAVAGGTTSFMDMPNVNPATITHDVLADKYALAADKCHANYAFYFGATNDNLEAIKSLSPEQCCGIKAFLGASTGNLLVDDPAAIDAIFREAPVLVVTHCEDSPTIWANEKKARERWGNDVPIAEHPNIRSSESCLISSTMATGLARQHDARLHVLHLTTADEMVLFEPGPIDDKRITAEVCIHHLWFDEGDYADLGTRIKCNPAIKKRSDRDALRAALLEGRLDVIATDHAPHLIEEKERHYFAAPAGLPLTEHALVAALDLTDEMDMDVAFVVDKLAHAPAKLFGIIERGHLREGYYADLALVDSDANWLAEDANARAKCGWTPFRGNRFRHRVVSTWVNGMLAWDGTDVLPMRAGRPLLCNAAR
ncbi:MAG: dihydroorotase [Pseudomonadota bacterium]